MLGGDTVTGADDASGECLGASGSATAMAAAAMRRLIEAHMASSDVPDEVMLSIADALDNVTGMLLPHVPDVARPWVPSGGGMDPAEFFPRDPVIGEENPIAAPVRTTLNGNTLSGEVTFGSAYQGPPGCVHGAVIAATFDELLGAVNMCTDNSGVTGTLTIRFRNLTPLQTPLKVSATFVRRDGRKIYSVGSISNGDVVTAEAEGIFIALDPLVRHAVMTDTKA